MRFKYDQETKDRAVRMFEERRKDAPGESRVAREVDPLLWTQGMLARACCLSSFGVR